MHIDIRKGPFLDYECNLETSSIILLPASSRFTYTDYIIAPNLKLNFDSNFSENCRFLRNLYNFDLMYAYDTKQTSFYGISDSEVSFCTDVKFLFYQRQEEKLKIRFRDSK